MNHFYFEIIGQYYGAALFVRKILWGLKKQMRFIYIFKKESIRSTFLCI